MRRGYHDCGLLGGRVIEPGEGARGLDGGLRCRLYQAVEQAGQTRGCTQVGKHELQGYTLVSCGAVGKFRSWDIVGHVDSWEGIS